MSIDSHESRSDHEETFKVSDFNHYGRVPSTEERTRALMERYIKDNVPLESE